MTSAPRSANSLPSSPPATMTPRSRIRSPSNGRFAGALPGGSGASVRGAVQPGFVCVHRRGGAGEPHVAAVDDEWACRHRDVDAGCDGCFREGADRPEMLAVQGLRRAEHRGDRHSPRLARCDQFLHRLGGEQIGHQRVDLCGCGVASGDRVEFRIGELGRFTQPGPHPTPLARRKQTDSNVAVATREGRVDLLVSGSAAPQLAGFLEADGGLTLGTERRIERLNHRLEAGKVNVIACAVT